MHGAIFAVVVYVENNGHRDPSRATVPYEAREARFHKARLRERVAVDTSAGASGEHSDDGIFFTTQGSLGRNVW